MAGAACGFGSATGAAGGAVSERDLTLAALRGTFPGAFCIHEFMMTATIPARQSSTIATNTAGTSISPFPKYKGEFGSFPMTRAIKGTIRWLVSDSTSP